MAAEGVLLLDDNQDLLDTLADTVRLVSGRPSLKLRNVAELRSQREAALGCALAILDIHLGANQPSGLDAYELLVAAGFAGRIVFLTGHAGDHPLVRRVSQLGGIESLRKPIELDAFRRLFQAAPAESNRAP